MKNLAGKYCIVTGAGKGIGRAIAERFLDEQAAGVAILEWDIALAEATAKELDPTVSALSLFVVTLLIPMWLRLLLTKFLLNSDALTFSLTTQA